YLLRLSPERDEHERAAQIARDLRTRYCGRLPTSGRRRRAAGPHPIRQLLSHRQHDANVAFQRQTFGRPSEGHTSTTLVLSELSGERGGVRLLNALRSRVIRRA